MNETIFRSVDFWKSAMTTLSDGPFFDLLRSVFGNVKTPYNKQKLINELTVFLLKEEIQKIISGYIDEQDARVIAALAALKEPAPGELESFFAGELNYAELHDILLNLEERFIIYRFREEETSRIALNPAMAPVLLPFISDPSLLFPQAEESAAGSAEISNTPGTQVKSAVTGTFTPVLNGRVLAGFLSFVAEEGSFFKAEGVIRKRILENAALVFPGLNFESLIGGLHVLGLFRIEADTLVPDYQRFTDFAALSVQEEMEYCAAGIYCFRIEKDLFSPAISHLVRNRLRSVVEFLHRLIDMILSEQWYPAKTLRRYGGILERQDMFIRGQIDFDLLFDSCVKAGLLLSRGEDLRRSPASSETAVTANDVKRNDDAPVLAMDTPFSCILYPELAFTDALSLASFSGVREAGATVRFEITRTSVIRGFDRGISAETMIDLLKRLSGDRISETLSWTLKDWEKRYGEISLHKGVVLSLSEERRYLADAQPIAGLIKEILAPGVYLLSVSDTHAAAEALEKAGVDIIANCAVRKDGGITAMNSEDNNFHHSYFPSLKTGQAFKLIHTVDTNSKVHFVNELSSDALKERFRSALEKMKLSKEERDELSARIERRLVLNESQLEGTSVRYEKLEARGLDYVGKAAIAKQAVASKSMVEICWNEGGKANRVFGIPTAMEKLEGESILVLNPLDEDAGGQVPVKAIRVPLGKISLLRRIKKSIFGE
jgi:hypothetical protein